MYIFFCYIYIHILVHISISILFIALVFPTARSAWDSTPSFGCFLQPAHEKANARRNQPSRFAIFEFLANFEKIFRCFLNVLAN